VDSEEMFVLGGCRRNGSSRERLHPMAALRERAELVQRKDISRAAEAKRLPFQVARMVRWNGRQMLSPASLSRSCIHSSERPSAEAASAAGSAAYAELRNDGAHRWCAVNDGRTRLAKSRCIVVVHFHPMEDVKRPDTDHCMPLKAVPHRGTTVALCHSEQMTC
jgi:hypothetical protein